MSTAEPVRADAPRRLSAGQRRARIETAAVRVFARRGYDAAALGEIAEEAGVTRTVLYDHFPSKRALYLHVLATQNQSMLAGVAAGITGAGDEADRLRSTIAAYLRFAADHPDARRLLVDPAPTGDEGIGAVLEAYRTARTQAVVAMLGPDLARAGLAPGSSEATVVVDLLIAGVDGIARSGPEHGGLGIDRVSEVAARVLWNGLPRAGA